ncbi:MAG: VPLPA-CTERM sorting domain-containing protein [Gammaproteobacteria bacterium]|nr:VPLPA-CTERM sorting domain-containing protein [Gammaproteobacteria bacterium]
MKINIILLALTSLISTHPAASTVHDKSAQLERMAASEHSAEIDKFVETHENKRAKQPVFEQAFKSDENNPGKNPNKPDFELADHFDPHQGFKLDEHRNFHAYNRGLQGLSVASAHVSSVPVPAALWLFISGLSGMMIVSTRRKAK